MYNNDSTMLLFLIFLGLFANANNLDLANNTSILLLLALSLFGGNFNNGCCNNGNNGCGCGCSN